MSVRAYKDGKPLPRGPKDKNNPYKPKAPTPGSKTQRRKADKAAHMKGCR